MAEDNRILRLRILLCFWNDENKSGSVTRIARVLGEQKYTITRMLNTMEQEGLVDRSDIRCPRLTEKGLEEAAYYSRRIELTMNHLLYEGVKPEYAMQDARYWALYNSQQTMDILAATEERYRVKYELRNKKHFSGALLCRYMKDGTYHFPFLIYRETARAGDNISMMNECFCNPCTLSVKQGTGMILLRTQSITKKMADCGREVRVKIGSVEYYDGDELINAEMQGNVVILPMAPLRFVNIGEGVGQILHGSIRLSFEGTKKRENMPELTAIFTIMI